MEFLIHFGSLILRPSPWRFWPISYLSVRSASIVWMICCAICLWIAAIQAGLLYRALSGDNQRVEGMLVVGAVLLPRALLACRIGNISPLVACCFGAGTLAMLRYQPIRAALAIAIGTLAKYAPGVLLIVLIVRRQWKAISWLALFTAVTVFLTLAIEGVQPFRIFFTDIWPTLQRPTWNWTSQTLWGASTEFVHDSNIASTVHTLLKILEGIAFLSISAALFIRRTAIRTSGSHAIAAILLLLCWLLLFGPITWAHYAIYFVPFVGWLGFVAQQNRWLKAASAICIILTFLPWNAFTPPGPIGYALSHFSLLLGIMLFALIASFVLLNRDSLGSAQR